MKPTELDKKNMAAVFFLTLSHFAVPDIGYLSNVKNLIFILGLVFIVITVPLSKALFNTVKTSEDYKVKWRKVSLPFFKSGMILVFSALLSAAFSAPTMIIMTFVYGAFLSFIISIFCERQVPSIFKAEDVQRAKKVIRLGLFPLTLSSLVMFFLYELSDLYAFFVMVYVIAFFLVILWLCCIVVFLYRLLTMKFKE